MPIHRTNSNNFCVAKIVMDKEKIMGKKCLYISSYGSESKIWHQNL
jgi:hypothetical protein